MTEAVASCADPAPVGWIETRCLQAAVNFRWTGDRQGSRLVAADPSGQAPEHYSDPKRRIAQSTAWFPKGPARSKVRRAMTIRP